MKRISTFLLFSLFSFMPCVVLAHEGHYAGPHHQHIAEFGAVIVSAVLALIMYAYYRQR